MTEIRPARPSDADEMAEVQNAIYRAGLRAGPVDAALVRERYLDMEYGVACLPPERDGRVVGFQSLKRAWPRNPYDVPRVGIIRTHIRLTLVEVESAAACHLAGGSRTAGCAHRREHQTSSPRLLLSDGFKPYRMRGHDSASL